MGSRIQRWPKLWDYTCWELGEGGYTNFFGGGGRLDSAVEGGFSGRSEFLIVIVVLRLMLFSRAHRIGI